MAAREVRLLKLKGYKQRTAWHLAAQHGHVEVLQALVAAVLSCGEAEDALNSSFRCGWAEGAGGALLCHAGGEAGSALNSTFRCGGGGGGTSTAVLPRVVASLCWRKAGQRRSGQGQQLRARADMSPPPVPVWCGVRCRRLLSLARTGDRLARHFMNARSKGGATPLILAARAGRAPAVAYLLSAGELPPSPVQPSASNRRMQAGGAVRCSTGEH